MAFVITEPCATCKDGSCVAVCPVDAIHTGKLNANGTTYDQFFINPEECICCGICEPECPVDAIFADDELPEEWKRYAGINATFYGMKSRG